ncbi:MAG: hypothetical protein K8L99_14035 [Anaerolineae bacterium]|nr:hypothetical protein [Anaerolineae bacterium]
MVYSNWIDHDERTAGAFGRRGLPRRRADQHAVGWSAVRHVGVAHQPLRRMRSQRFSWRPISARHTLARAGMT